MSIWDLFKPKPQNNLDIVKPYQDKINTLNLNIIQLQNNVSELTNNYINSSKTVNTLQTQIEQLKSEIPKTDPLETYWNDRIPKIDMSYSARPVFEKFESKDYSWTKDNIPIDPRTFINPDNNTPISIGKNNDEKVNNALGFVITNITYTPDPKNSEFWKEKYETWYDKKGDCEDGAIILANILIKSGVPYWRIRLNVGEVKGGRHCYLTYLRESDNVWYVIDWCYWPTNSKNFGLKWKDAENNYFTIDWSFNKKYIFKKEELDRTK